MASLPDDARQLRLRYEATCAFCGSCLPRGTYAVWSRSTRAVYCAPCAGGAGLAISLAGTPGAAAMKVHERRQAKDAAAIRSRWGRLAPIAERIATPKQATEAWRNGAIGEQRLAAFLERELAGEAILIHDRRIPGRSSNIDHIAVGPSGVWVIDAKRYTGKIEKRDVGGWLKTDLRVYVNGRDRTKLVKAVPKQVETVRAALALAAALADVPVRGTVCFTDSDWGFLNLGKAFEIDGILVSYPGALRGAILEPRWLSPEAVGRIAARLATELNITR